MLSNEFDELGNARINRRISVEGAPVAPGHHSDNGAILHQRTTRVPLTSVYSARTGTQMERPDGSKVLIRYAACAIIHNRYRYLLEVAAAGSLVLKTTKSWDYSRLRSMDRTDPYIE